MKLKEIMSTEVEIVRSDASIQEAAEKMASLDVGALGCLAGLCCAHLSRQIC